MKRRGLIGFLIAGTILWFFPPLQERLDLPLFYLIFMYFLFFWIAQASSWNILSGYSGYFSFGQGAFYGIGVYTTAVLVFKQEINFIFTLPIAGLAAIILGLVIGFVVFRLRQLKGELFALLTLAVSFVLAGVARNTDYIDGGFGIPLGAIPHPEVLGDFSTMLYRLGMIIALLTVFASYSIYHARLGRGLFAIRDDEEVAEGIGVPTFRAKMIAFGATCFFAGLSGGLHALQLNYVTVESVFGIRVPLFVIMMSILGGRSHWLGPVIGAVVIFTINDRFSSAELEGVNRLIIGSLLIIMILFVREGIYGRLRGRIAPSLAVFVLVIILQIVVNGFDDKNLITQISVAMLAVILLLLIPEALYSKLLRAGRRDPVPA